MKAELPSVHSSSSSVGERSWKQRAGRRGDALQGKGTRGRRSQITSTFEVHEGEEIAPRLPPAPRFGLAGWHTVTFKFDFREGGRREEGERLTCVLP